MSEQGREVHLDTDQVRGIFVQGCIDNFREVFPGVFVSAKKEERPMVAKVSGRMFNTWLREVRAKAWAEGFDAGERDVWEHMAANEWDNCIPNPYREAESLGVEPE